MAFRATVLVGLVAIVASACGGRTVLSGVGGLPAGDSGAPEGDSGRDTGVRPEAGVRPTCPPEDELFELGSACTFTGVCTVDLDPCATGEGSPTEAVCTDGAVALPPGTGIGCSHTTSTPCPAGTATGGACAFDPTTTCMTTFCGAVATCSCEDGLWNCLGEVACSPPAELCIDGNECASEGQTCAEIDLPPECSGTCVCSQEGMYMCASGCAGLADAGTGGGLDAGAPLEVCAADGPCTPGPCFAPDGCGGKFVCQCGEDGGITCPPPPEC